MQGWEAALWRTLTAHWLDPNTAIPTHVLAWLVHATPPARYGIDIAWAPYPHPL